MGYKRHIQRIYDKNKQAVEQLLAQVEQGQIEFVLTEVQTARTFCEVALSTSDPERKKRNIENAVKGHQTALRFSQMPERGLKNDNGFQEELAHLKDLLHSLGLNV